MVNGGVLLFNINISKINNYNNSKMQDARCKMQDARCKIQDQDCRMHELTTARACQKD
jgi:hypothetical protein